MDNGIFNARIYVNACDCARGCMDTVRESGQKVDSGKKIPCRTGNSNLLQRLAGPMLYQLSYIPTSTCVRGFDPGVDLAFPCGAKLGQTDFPHSKSGPHNFTRSKFRVHIFNSPPSPEEK